MGKKAKLIKIYPLYSILISELCERITNSKIYKYWFKTNDHNFYGLIAINKIKLGKIYELTLFRCWTTGTIGL